MRRLNFCRMVTPALAAAGCVEIGPGGIEAKIGIDPVKAGH